MCSLPPLPGFAWRNMFSNATILSSASLHKLRSPSVNGGPNLRMFGEAQSIAIAPGEERSRCRWVGTVGQVGGEPWGHAARGGGMASGAAWMWPFGCRGGDHSAGIGYRIAAVETGAAPVPTATVFPIPRPQTVRCTARGRVSLPLGL